MENLTKATEDQPKTIGSLAKTIENRAKTTGSHGKTIEHLAKTKEGLAENHRTPC